MWKDQDFIQLITEKSSMSLFGLIDISLPKEDTKVSILRYIKTFISRNNYINLINLNRDKLINDSKSFIYKSIPRSDKSKGESMNMSVIFF